MRHIWQIGISLLFLLTVAYGQTAEDQLASAHSLLQAGKNDAAIAKLSEISANHPTLRGLSHELGVAYYGKADYLSAILYLRRALEEDKRDRDALQLLGLAYYLSGHPAQAIPYLQQLQAEDSEHTSDVAFVLGLCYALTQDYERALNVISGFYGLPPGSAFSRLIFARVLVLQGLDPIAEQQVREVLKQAPKTPLAHFVLGQVYLYRSDLPRAITEFQAELATNPAYPPALTRLGDAYTRAGRLDDALTALRRSIWLDAAPSGSYLLLGKVLLRKRQFALALRMLQRAIDLDPNDYTAHQLLGEAYRQLGEAGLATHEMQTGARLQQRQSAQNRR